MWINPKYATAAPPPQPPPEERGERLATIPRGQGGEELRINLDEFNGHPFISIRVWAIGSDGQHWPTKKGTSIKIRELAEVARALMLAESIVHGPPERPARQALPHAGRGDRGDGR